MNAKWKLPEISHYFLSYYHFNASDLFAGTGTGVLFPELSPFLREADDLIATLLRLQYAVWGQHQKHPTHSASTGVLVVGLGALAPPPPPPVANDANVCPMTIEHYVKLLPKNKTEMSIGTFQACREEISLYIIEWKKFENGWENSYMVMTKYVIHVNMLKILMKKCEKDGKTHTLWRTCCSKHFKLFDNS